MTPLTHVSSMDRILEALESLGPGTVRGFAFFVGPGACNEVPIHGHMMSGKATYQEFRGF
jgi:hypothetical protein